jgi:hypothetical protein
VNTTFKEIAAAARRLHRNYGAGDVQWVHVFADGRIEVCAKRTSCAPRVYIGRLTGKRSVRLHGHQTCIGFAA